MQDTNELNQPVIGTIGDFYRSQRQGLVGILAAGVLGWNTGPANAQLQTQSAKNPAGDHWEAFEDGPNWMVTALAAFDEPGSRTGLPALYAGGRFATVGGSPAKCIARWCEGGWSPLGQSVQGEAVEALTVFDEDGPGPSQPALYVGGGFKKAGGVSAQNIARWSGAEWSAVGNGIDGLVLDLAVFDEDYDGPRPPALFAVGIFTRAGDTAAKYIAKWDGREWSAVDQGLAQPAYSVIVADPDGEGPAKPGLIVGGMNTVDLWDGTKWYSFGDGPGFRTFALAAFDHDGDGRPALYAAGQIIHQSTNMPTTIAFWDGNDWTPLPDALDDSVYALTVFDPDGNGTLRSALYVAGSFTKVGDRPAHGLAKWDGTNWSTFEDGPRSDPLSPRMNCLAILDRDGSGPLPATLCVGGLFTLNGQKNSGNVAGWSNQPPQAIERQ